VTHPHQIVAEDQYTSKCQANNLWLLSELVRLSPDLTLLMIGIYGMSTALWMLREGGYEVTILDRCEELPALDAASTGAYTVSFLSRGPRADV
jgi:hypothetical protein